MLNNKWSVERLQLDSFVRNFGYFALLGFAIFCVGM
jgi:hypothetical protein